MGQGIALFGCYNGGVPDESAERKASERSVPLLKREAEVWPPDLFEAKPDGGANGTAAAAATNGHGANGSPPIVNGHGRLPAAALDEHGLSRWWVAYTRSRQEKGLARHLLQWEVPFYLPQYERRLRAGDRIRTSHLPLFTGYVFFRGDLHDRTTALRSNLIVNLIDPLDQEQLATELRSLWLLQTTGEPLVPHPYLGPGDEVEVTGGALKGYRGLVLREKGKYRLVVSITLLRQAVGVEIDREMLAPAQMRRVATVSGRAASGHGAHDAAHAVDAGGARAGAAMGAERQP